MVNQAVILLGDTTKLGLVLEAIHDRLAGVTVECLDWRAFLGRWNRPGTLFYLDPPYWGTEDYYRASFPPADQAALPEALRDLKGRFHPDHERHGRHALLLRPRRSDRDGGPQLYAGQRGKR
jgi:hypothetical protein